MRLKLFPDTGLAAMLQNQWPDATFKIGSITSRTPISAEDEVVVLPAPDPQSFSFVQDIMERLPDHSTLIMFNPRLSRYIHISFGRVQCFVVAMLV